jgi:hypothetical protein
MSHDQFNAEPVHAVRWMLEIDRLYAEARKRERSQPPEGGLM